MLHHPLNSLKFLFLVAALGLASVPSQAQDAGQTDATEEEEDYPVPVFRHIDPTAEVPPLRDAGTVRFITDADFPPFSYRDAFGSLTGFNVMLAEALCADLRLNCEFVPRAWEDLVPALEAGEGDAILGGLAISPDVLQSVDFTRPYFRTLARFAVREGTLPGADPEVLAGERVGVMAGTAHEAFLRVYFSRSDIRPFDNATEAREALRTGDLDAIFDDAVRHMFWLASPASRNCCGFSGGAYLDPAYFSRPLAIAVARGDESLRAVLDYGLDRVQASGDFARAYRLFFPMPPWRSFGAPSGRVIARQGGAFDGGGGELVELERVAQAGEKADFLAPDVQIGDRHLDRQRIGRLGQPPRQGFGDEAENRLEAVLDLEHLAAFLGHARQLLRVEPFEDRQRLDHVSDAPQFAVADAGVDGRHGDHGIDQGLVVADGVQWRHGECADSGGEQYP